MKEQYILMIMSCMVMFLGLVIGLCYPNAAAIGFMGFVFGAVGLIINAILIVGDWG